MASIFPSGLPNAQLYACYNATVIYLLISYIIFELTGVLKSAFIPSRDNNRLYQNFVIETIVWCILGRIVHNVISFFFLFAEVTIRRLCIWRLTLQHEEVHSGILRLK